jgi:integrase
LSGVADEYRGVCSVHTRIATVKRAWDAAVLKAHGHTPIWTTSNKIDTASRTALKAIDLHFHDLRHEAGSRLLERGWPLHHVQKMLGHANLSQTSTYLNAERLGLQDSMRRFEKAPGCNPVAIEAPIDHRRSCNEETTKAPKAL